MRQSDIITEDPIGPILPPVKSRRSFSQLIATAILVFMDFFILAIALLSAFIMRMDIMPVFVKTLSTNYHPSLVYHLWTALGISILSLAHESLYTKRLPFWQETKQTVKGVTLAFLLTLAILFLGKTSDAVSRSVLMLGYIASIILLPIGRLVVKTALTRIGLGVKPVLILGVGKTGEMVARTLIRDKFLGYQIIGFLDDDPNKRVTGAKIDDTLIPVLGSFDDCDRLMEQYGIRHLILAAPGMPARKLVELVNRLQRRAASVTVIPDLFGVPVIGVEAEHYFDDKMLSFRIRNRLASPWNMLAKRVFDLVVSTIVVVATLPLIAAISIAIRLDSRGPAIFSQHRIGQRGKEFDCYKFRTMYSNNEEILQKYLEGNPKAKRDWDKYAKLKGKDPRVTPVGHLLRKFSLDELPQLINVLKGDMSLVGPRPYLPRESAKLSDHAASILLSRPGVTGLWQVSGRNEIDFDGRMDLESWYVRNWSLWLDITILIRTIGVVLMRKGAY